MKKLVLTIRLGFYSLFLHKLRAALAVLGILIGVTAVIWLVAMGEGISDEAQRQIKDLGATNIIIRTVKPSEDSYGSSSGNFTAIYGLTRDDYDRILTNCPWIRQAVKMREFHKKARFDQRDRSGPGRRAGRRSGVDGARAYGAGFLQRLGRLGADFRDQAPSAADSTHWQRRLELG